MYGDLDVPLFWEEELAAIDVGSEVEIDVGFVGTLGDGLFQGAESGCGVGS